MFSFPKLLGAFESYFRVLMQNLLLGICPDSKLSSNSPELLQLETRALLQYLQSVIVGFAEEREFSDFFILKSSANSWVQREAGTTIFLSSFLMDVQN